jgi:L-fucose isomerase-like protein
VLIDDLYGGTGAFLGHYPAARKAGKPVTGVSSTRIEDVCEAINTFAVIRKMKASKILVVTPREMQKTIDAIRANLGPEIVSIPAEELNAAWKAADRRKADEQAQAWMRRADRVVEPKPDEIRNSAAMYLGMASLVEKHRAQAIAVDCLELFYKQKMFAYPCLGFFQMNNDGLVGACEADLTSASTMLLLRYLTGRASYISDPVIDTAKNQIIYAHCVAPSKVYGPDGPECAYEIRDHSEDRKGAAIRSILPLGETLSTLEFVSPAKTVVFHLSRAVDNLEEDRACRTKLAAEVRDARRLMEGWDFGWHRVTVYGDWKTQVAHTAALLGWKFVEEG